MTKIMGILNITPNSNYDGGRYLNREAALQRALQMFEEGADIIDIGGESTRPGADSVTEEEELGRVLPIIKELRRQTPLPFSIDTSNARVAAAALEAGATMINDVRGFRDKEMRQVAAEARVDICVMHMQGIPATMQLQPSYPEGIIQHLDSYFTEQVALLVEAGVDVKRIIIDPGIGFGKTVADNLQIIQNLPIIKQWGFPVLLGVSRKSFMQRILNRPVAEMLAGTLTINTVAALAGVDIMRVHDVLPHRDLITLLEQLKKC